MAQNTYKGYKYESMTPEAKEGNEVASGTVITLTYVKDNSQTKPLSYTVEYYKNGVKDEEKTQTKTIDVWVNSEQTTLPVDKAEINTTNAFGDAYRFVNTDPASIPNEIANGSIIKVYYVAKEEPQLQLTKTARDNYGEITNIVYNPNKTNTFTYRLKVENVVADSYPSVVTETQTVKDLLPEGISVYGRLPQGVTSRTVTENGVQREELTWTVNNIGYGENAKYVDINVEIDENVFKNKEVDLGTETTVLDIKLAQYKDDDESIDRWGHTISDTTGNKMNLFIRTEGETSNNDGYIYAGTIDVGTKVTEAVFASDEFNNNDKVNEALKNEAQLERMLNDFVTANDDGTMARYTKNGLPSEEDINKTLAELYTDRYGRPVVQLSDTQVILWYKVTKNDDTQRTRYFRITDDGKKIFEDGVELPACNYHLDGIVVNVSDLGTVIPTGAQVNATNTAELIGITGPGASDSATVSIHYKQQRSSYATNLLSAIIEDEELNTESVDEIVAKADEYDNSNTETVETKNEENKVEEVKEESTTNNSSEITTVEDKEETISEEEKKEETVTSPEEEETVEKDQITSSDDKNKNEQVQEVVTPEVNELSETQQEE